MRQSAMMLGLLLAGLATVLAAPGQAKAGDEKKDVLFLGRDPIGPLAVVSDGKLATPSDSACRAWGPVGTHWIELDKFGRGVGTVTVTERDRYDVSNCDELSVKHEQGKAGAGIYVDATDAHLGAFRPWRPRKSARAALEKTAHELQKPIKVLEKNKHVAFTDRVLFFEARSAKRKTRWAVVGGVSIAVFRWDGRAWTKEFEERPPKDQAMESAYLPIAVLDMNGDGEPEIVWHNKESEGEWYGDWTASRDKDGVWKTIRAGIFGSTG